MPMDMIAVADVTVRPIGRGTPKYDVRPVMADGQVYAPIYETFDPLTASLCERAKVRGFFVVIGWRETRYGREIVTVRRAGDEEAV